MGFLILIGALSLMLSLAIKKNLQWTVSENSCNAEKEEKKVKKNKLMWNISFYGGIVLLVVGIIGELCF